ncbi:MAG: hypothetical protein ACYTFA_05645 [Planctomycetota bacterium]|jgi:hypothetical protein
MKHCRSIHIEASLLLALVGCASTPSSTEDAARERMLALLMPGKIEIVAPFTRVKSFDDDTTPDGIELLLQAVNSLDDPGIIVGSVHVDLLEYVPASSDPKGQRLEYWDVDLSTKQQQRRYWNQATQMYEFRLEVDPSLIPAQERFVLQVRYTSPLDEHLTDECIIDIRAAGRASRGSARRSKASEAPGGR